MAVQLFYELAFAFLLVIPVWRIHRRAGFSGAWALLLFVPYLGPLAVLLNLSIRSWQIGGKERSRA